MRISHLLLPSAALTAAGLLLSSTELHGFNANGDTLNNGQRHFRVFNNFTDASANNNQTPHPNWPGWQGADMAIWKACVEWGSIAHGDGTGDGHQNTVGSGGANFDTSWQGNASAVGSTDDNTHSELSGCNGGVFAFAEGPYTNGWRIRYYECWNWRDGPDSAAGGVDLQGIATHEYGHALGLNHSNANGATMLPGCNPPCNNQRSINSDDKAGVQFVYGTIGANKPQIDSLSLAGNQLTIAGFNFTDTTNQVWFLDSSGTDGTPLKLTGVDATNGGTEIVVTVPNDAGPGDVLVKRQGAGFGTLSNAMPFDPPAQMCDPAVNYCLTSVNSTGSSAVISTTGTLFVSNDDFGLRADDCPANKSGIFYFGPNQIQQVFGEGIRCVGGSTTRLPQNLTDALGVATEAVDLTGLGILGGQTHNFQFWFRDPMGGPAGYNLTDAVEVLFCE